MKHKKRDYKDEYKKFQMGGQIKKRALRNKNRKKLMAGGKVKLGDGKDIHHVGNKLTVMSASKNRGMKGEGGRKKGVPHKSKN